MSCFSIPDPLYSDNDDDTPPPSPTATTGKPDFSVFKQTIGRQFKNVATFLAPPPQQSSSSSPPQTLSHDSGELTGEASPSSIEGVKNDLAEIGASFKTGLSLLSPKKAVTQFSKLASNLLQSDKGDNDVFEKVSGVTEDLVLFVGMLSNRPNLWIDFPLSLSGKEFSMSSIQKDHTVAIEQLVPSITTLRHTVQNYMSEQQFWMTYFVLMFPRFNEDDYYKHLLTSEIVLVYDEVMEKLRNRKNTFQETDALCETSNAPPYRRKNRNQEDDISVCDLDNETSSGVRQTQSSKLSSANEFSDWVRLSDASKANRSTYHEGRSYKSDSSVDGGNQSNKNQEEDVSSASETSDWVNIRETAKAKRGTYRERRSESEESSDWHTVDDVVGL
ncbi:uncharacterized protein [Rutidosis leptorrhynchoides]|uniref:uncharacterized protein n=1 Tax=Rutidosis leptorrhynchoides TaxID=125765 RepID=UPI003A99BD5B